MWRGLRRGNDKDVLVLAAEAASAIKLKTDNDDDVVPDGSLLEEVIAGIGVGAMGSNIPDVGMSNEDDDDDDVRCHHPAGLLFFWVQTFGSNIPTPLSLDPLDMLMMQRNFASCYYSAVGGVMVLLSLAVSYPF
jgi:hypothetical protein